MADDQNQTQVPQVVRTAFQNIETILTQAFDERQRVAATGYGYGPAGVPLDLVQAMTKRYQGQLSDAAQAAQEALDAAMKDAQDARNTAIREDALSPMGQRYLALIPALAATFPTLSVDEVAKRLAQALDSHLTADVRAYLELIRANYPVVPAKLVGLVQLAEREVIAPALAEADARAQTLNGIAWRWGLAKNRLNDRLGQVLEYAKDPAATGYAAPFILGDSKATNSSFKIGVR